MSSTQSKDKGAELEKRLFDIQTKRAEENAMSLAQKLGLPFSDLKSAPIDADAMGLIDEESARKSQLAPITKNGSNLAVVVIDPENTETIKMLKELNKRGFKINIIITSFAALEKVFARYKTEKTIDVFKQGTIEIKEEKLKEYKNQIKSLSDIKNKVTKISATEMLEILVAGALQLSASDIHFEPETEEIRLRYRLDGVLNDIATIDKDSYLKVLNRIKVLSKLKLNVTKTPQDGRFTIKETGVDIEVRVSILPSEFGETIVMRLLDPRTIKTKLEDLGMREDLLKTVKNQLQKTTGSILTTGPTGSGKTTTLYAFIQRLNSSGTKIITIEDPIEYHIKGISQTQVNSKKEYTFANGLRAIVRQDPDIILVGEIRDQETADIALQAALTGHLVFSTIHTNDASGTIPRLIDLGIQPQIIAPAINMAMAQRLIRKLCQNCKIEKNVETKNLEEIKVQLDSIKDRLKFPKIDQSLKIYFPGKCKECNETGYKGRIGIYEAFIVTKEMEKLILKGPAISDIQDLAVAQGMITMAQDAYIKLTEGITSKEEIERVLG